MRIHHATFRALLINSFDGGVKDLRVAHANGLDMVHRHCTLVPALAAAENLAIGRTDVSAVVGWDREMMGLRAFMDTMPFRVPLDAPVHRLAASEKQKLGILRQLCLGRRFMIPSARRWHGNSTARSIRS